MPISDRENFLRAIEFRYPEWIPVGANSLRATWAKYREDLEDLYIRHPKIFGNYERGSYNWNNFEPAYTEGEYYTDEWGCVWHNLQTGLLGQCVGHPLADWSAFDNYQAPDPISGTDWEQHKRNVAENKTRGELTMGYGGTLFDLLYALRGFENLMMDFATDEPRLPELIQMVQNYNLKKIEKFTGAGVDVINFHGDIGTQRGPMISPAAFRKYVKPWYKTIWQACRQGGAHVYYSCDGNLLSLVDELIECGMTLHDPQSRANTLEGIRDTYIGKVCFKLDLDQQVIMPFGTPAEVKSYIKHAVNMLNDPKGGFMIMFEVQPAYPLENIEAACEVLEEVCLANM
ncbi:MAG: uroporphyrinogen decarboxylase family protein [bacterium]